MRNSALGSRDRHRQERRVRAAQRNRRARCSRCRADERRGSKAVERVARWGSGRSGGARCASRAGGTCGTGSAGRACGARRARRASCTAVALQRSVGLLAQILLLQRPVDDLGRADAVLRGERDGCVTLSLLAPRTAQRSEMMVAGDGRRLKCDASGPPPRNGRSQPGPAAGNTSILARPSDEVKPRKGYFRAAARRSSPRSMTSSGVASERRAHPAPAGPNPSPGATTRRCSSSKRGGVRPSGRRIQT